MLCVTLILAFSPAGRSQAAARILSWHPVVLAEDFPSSGFFLYFIFLLILDTLIVKKSWGQNESTSVCKFCQIRKVEHISLVILFNFPVISEFQASFFLADVAGSLLMYHSVDFALTLFGFHYQMLLR